MNVSNVSQADTIEMDWVVENVDFDQARTNYHCQPQPNQEIRQGFEMPELGTWRLDEWGEMSVLIEIPINEFEPSEGEWEIALQYPSTQAYIAWQKAGHEPPPLDVVTTDKDNLRSCNRRRWLAARETGVKSLKCWYSPTHPEHCASPKWALKWIVK